MDFAVDKSLEVLRNMPAVLRTLLNDLSDPWILNNYGENTFSPFDVVGHLIHGERTDWIPRAQLMLEHGDSRAFEPFDRYAMFEASKGKTIVELLDTFESLRRENIKILEAMHLTPEMLARPGKHPELGLVSLENHLALWTVHDLNHIAQICKSMAYQYGDALGSWRPYVSILPR